MGNPPLPEVIAAIEAPTTDVTRRVAFFESDGVTPWLKPGDESRLISGTVSVDYARDERRAMDLLLDNSDGLLSHDPETGLWYDKIIKVYRGVEYNVEKTQPRILVIQDSQLRMRTELRNLGFTDVTLKLTASVLADLQGYDIIVADSYQSALTGAKVTLLIAAYAAGFDVFTCSNEVDETVLPFITASISKSAGTNWAMAPVSGDTPLAGGWGSVASFGVSDVGRLPTSLATTAQAIATMTFSGTVGYVAIINTSVNNTRWFHLGIAERETNTRTLITNGFVWLWNFVARKTYETTIGTFMIDRIGEDYFPNQIKVTGRDYTKKLMLTKISQALIFITGTSLETIINAVAANAGVTDTRLNLSGAVLTSDVSFEKNTPRWDILKQICDAYQFEIFFDAFGVLVVRPFLDPLTSPTSLTLKTGQAGNLVSYSKSSNDSRIFNHVTVTCDNQDLISGGILIFGEALNTEPSSPTGISRLGDRTYPYVSSVITDVDQANLIAQSFLSIMALEEFDLNFDTLVYPWIEAGEIFAFIDPKAGNGEPSRFLLSNFTLPLTLGTMPGVGRRVTIVGPGSVPGSP